MKILLCLLSLCIVISARAASASSSAFDAQSITIPGNRYTLNFEVQWVCDDYPRDSAPGQIELVDSGGGVVGSISASVYPPGDISISGGSITNANASATVYAPNGAPAEANLTGTWNITGVAPGNYLLRFYRTTTWDTSMQGTTVWTSTWNLGGSAPMPPTIDWTAAPGSIGSGQSYTISAHGHDADGNLSAVSIWKNGQPFAFAGGGNGSDGDSSNPTADSGAAIVTFTAQATDSDGQSSPVISQTVEITSLNEAPTITWNTTPGVVAAGQNYTISAHGHDPDGNLTQVNIWREGQPYAFSGGGNGTDGDSGNPSTDTGPLTITYTAQAVDAAGAMSATISQTVTISTPPVVAAAISVSPTNTSAPGSATITWSSADATSVFVSGNGLSSSATNGSQIVDGLGAGSYPYTITAQGYGGPVSQTATFTVNAAPSVAASISATPSLSTAPGSGVISWNSANAVAVSVTGPGISSNAASGIQWINGLGPGSYDYAIIAQGPNGPATQTVTITVVPADRTVFAAVSPSGTGWVSGAGVYPEGSDLTLTATADATHVFTGWTGDLSGASNPLRFTVGPQNYNVVANFAPLVQAAKIQYRGAARALLDHGTTTHRAPLVIHAS